MKIFLTIFTLATAIYVNPYGPPAGTYDKPANPYNERYCDFDGAKKPC